MDGTRLGKELLLDGTGDPDDSFHAKNTFVSPEMVSDDSAWRAYSCLFSFAIASFSVFSGINDFYGAFHER